MTTQQSPKFWSRLASSLKFKRPRAERPHDLPEIGDDGLLAEPAELPDDLEAESVPGRSARPLARWSKRDQTLAKLQEGYEQVTEVIGEIRNHLKTHADRSERICTSLEQLARAMSDVPDISRQQARTLEVMADQLQATSTRTQQLAESMDEMPKVARAQGEALAGINRQLEMASEHNVVASQAMDKLGTAIGMLGESSRTQAQTLKEMDTRTAASSEQFVKLIDRQGRRFIMLFVVTTVLAAAAITLGILALVLR